MSTNGFRAGSIPVGTRERLNTKRFREDGKMSTINYGDGLTVEDFFNTFDESRWFCKCGHIADRHPEETQDTDPCWDCVECSGLSDEPITVLELLNKHYNTDWDAPEYEDQLPSKWSHVLTTGPYNHNLVINNTVSREVHGYTDPLGQSNYEVLQENWKDHPALCDGGWSDHYSIGLHYNSPAPWDLVERIDSLEGYPALDDERMSQIEFEWIDEGWQDYGISDALRFLGKLLSDNGFEFDLDSDVLKDELRQDICRDDSNPPYWETGGGAVFHHDKIVPAHYEKYLFGLKMSQPWDEPTN